VVYHFVLVDSTIEVTRAMVKKGDAFDRFFLRLFRIRPRGWSRKPIVYRTLTTPPKTG
jgi:hypothetical protein